MELVEAHEHSTLSSWQEGVIAEDILAVERVLDQGLKSEDKLPQALAARLLRAGGKRIRPLLLCLCYRSQQKTAKTRSRVSPDDLHTLAAVAEWVHTATLFHDDVIDASEKRRGLDAAHTLHGNKVAILVGDFVYAEAFAILMERGLLAPSKKLAHTIKRLVEGELWQHSYSKTRRISLSEYEKVAECKTAALFAWATETGVWASGSDETEAGFEFGRTLGVAFQMADDLLDTYQLDPLSATHAELVEWMVSAPPLPLCIAKNIHLEINGLWKNLEHLDNEQELRTQVSKLQAFCCDTKVINDCESLLSKYLTDARKSLDSLGTPPSLLQAVELLENRGSIAVQCARSSRGTD
ncbi:polyprenyl synthetase family protein [bacterium]|nr:polyprenyl synthetase family protein [bacterium]